MGKPIKMLYAITCSIIYATKTIPACAYPKHLKSTTLNKEIEAKMYSKNEAILDFKKKKEHKMTNKKKKKKKKMNQLNFFQNVETDQPASRLRIQPI